MTLMYKMEIKKKHFLLSYS